MDQKVFECNSARVLQYLRKSSKMSQRQVSEIIGRSRSHCSRLEAAQKPLLYCDVLALVNTFKIDILSFQQGMVDMESKDDIRVFKIPKCFSKNANLSGHLANAFLSYFKSVAGNLEVDNFFGDEKVDPVYFVNCNNKINMYFILRVMLRMKAQGYLSNKDEARKLAEYVYSYLQLHNQVSETVVAEGQVSVLGIEKLMECFKNDLFDVIVPYPYPDAVTISITARAHLYTQLFLHDPLLEDSFLEFFSAFLICATGHKLSCDWQRCEGSVNYQLRK